MSEQQAEGESPIPGMAGTFVPSRTLADIYRSLPVARQRRLQTIFGGGLAGVGLGIALAWTLGIFQRANPQSLTDSGPAYPPMAATVFVVVIVAGLAIGIGVGMLAAAFIPRGNSEG